MGLGSLVGGPSMIDSWVHYLESKSKSSRWPAELPRGHQRAHQHSIPCDWLSSGNLMGSSQVPGVSTLLTSALGFRNLKPSKGANCLRLGEP